MSGPWGRWTMLALALSASLAHAQPQPPEQPPPQEQQPPPPPPPADVPPPPVTAITSDDGLIRIFGTLFSE